MPILIVKNAARLKEKMLANGSSWAAVTDGVVLTTAVISILRDNAILPGKYYQTPDQTNKQESKLEERLENRQPKRPKIYIDAKLLLSKFSSELFCSWHNLSRQQERIFLTHSI